MPFTIGRLGCDRPLSSAVQVHGARRSTIVSASRKKKDKPTAAPPSTSGAPAQPSSAPSPERVQSSSGSSGDAGSSSSSSGSPIPSGVFSSNSTGLSRKDFSSAPSSSGSAAGDSSTPTVKREWAAFGGKALETDAILTGPEDEKDFWEGESWEAFGVAMQRWFIPAVIAFGVVAGSIAASSYNDGATTYQTPSTPDSSIQLIPADALAPMPGQ